MNNPYTACPSYSAYPYYPYVNQNLFIPSTLKGMMVQSADSITADNVPMDGSIAFFPKNDMSEIYAKKWDANGTIKTVIFKPVLEDCPVDKTAEDLSVFSSMETKIADLKKQIDNLNSMMVECLTKETNNSTKVRSAANKKENQIT